MSLRTRLFLLLVALATLFAAGEWWLIRRTSQDLRKELEETAAAVSKRVVQVFAFRGNDDPTLPPPEGEDPTKPAPRHILRQEVKVIDTRGEPSADQKPHRIRVLTETNADGKPALRFEPAGEGDLELLTENIQAWVQAPGSDPMPAGHALSTPAAVPIPTEGTEKVVEKLARRLLGGTLALLALGLGLAAVVAHRVTAPLGDLVAAAEQLGQGKRGVRVPAGAGGEVGRALLAFNAMSDRLQELDADARALRSRQHLSELGEVGRGFAHSLRNPLNALGLAVDELARQSAPPGSSRAAELAGRARRQIRRIDESLRAFLALGTDGGRAATHTVDLGAVARDVALELAQSRPEGKETVRVEVMADRPAAVQGVEAELRAAVQALVVNAVEASPSEGVVKLHLEPVGSDGARLEVRDQGPGLPAEIRQRLFTPHVTTKPAGAGMGLYLAHRIATTRYGGHLDLADQPEGGTCATLELHGRASQDVAGELHG